MRLAIVAEDWENDQAIGTNLCGVSDDTDVGQLELVKGEFTGVMSDLPARED